jgi:hypothetical protein
MDRVTTVHFTDVDGEDFVHVLQLDNQAGTQELKERIAEQIDATVSIQLYDAIGRCWRVSDDLYKGAPLSAIPGRDPCSGREPTIIGCRKFPAMKCRTSWTR